MNTTNRTNTKWHVTSRVLAAFIPAFVLTNTLGVLCVLLLPLSKLTAIVYVAVFAFMLYGLLVMWIFHAKSLKKIWSWLTLAILASSAICYWLLQLEQAS